MNAPHDCADLAKFSPRERQIIASLVAAKQVREIAMEFHLTPNTVKAYIKGIYFKAEVHSVRELMLKFPPVVCAANERTETFNRVLAATDIAQLHAAVLALFRTWAGAKRVLHWEIPGDDIGRPAHPYGAKSLGFGPATTRADGPVLMAAVEAARDPFLSAASAGRPFYGEVCLVMLRLLRRTWLLALADPAMGRFAPDVPKLVRALARMAEHHADSFAPKMAAGVAGGHPEQRAG